MVLAGVSVAVALDREGSGPMSVVVSKLIRTAEMPKASTVPAPHQPTKMTITQCTMVMPRILRALTMLKRTASSGDAPPVLVEVGAREGSSSSSKKKQQRELSPSRTGTRLVPKQWAGVLGLAQSKPRAAREQVQARLYSVEAMTMERCRRRSLAFVVARGDVKATRPATPLQRALLSWRMADLLSTLLLVETQASNMLMRAMLSSEELDSFDLLMVYP